MVSPRNNDGTSFERLAKGIQNRLCEFGQLIQKQHRAGVARRLGAPAHAAEAAVGRHKRDGAVLRRADGVETAAGWRRAGSAAEGARASARGHAHSAESRRNWQLRQDTGFVKSTARQGFRVTFEDN